MIGGSFVWKNISGWCAVEYTSEGIKSLRFGRRSEEDASAGLAKSHEGKRPAFVDEAVRQLDEYFIGSEVSFKIPVDMNGATDFRKKVWKETAKVGYGKTITYGELARRIGSGGAARAVGSALGANNVPLIIPCHRILRSGGEMGGFALGISVKEALLDLERGKKVDNKRFGVRE